MQVRLLMPGESSRVARLSKFVKLFGVAVRGWDLRS